MLARLVELTAPALAPPPDATPEEVETCRAEARLRWQEAVDVGYDLLEKFPDAPGLSAVRDSMLVAARRLYHDDPAEIRRQQLVTICHDMLAAEQAPARRLPADAALAQLAFADRLPDEVRAREVLEGLVSRYETTDAASTALMAAASMAASAELTDTFNRFVDRLADLPSKDGPAVRFLARVGRPVPFQAELETLAGERLSLPKDLRGRTVLVVFWATWCPQSRRCEPTLRRLHNLYHDHGLSLVGVNLDPPGQAEALRTYVTTNGLNWPHGYSGQGADDPTFTYYALDATPSIWLIDADGHIITDDALSDPANPGLTPSLDNIERAVRRALDLTDRPDPED